MKLLAAFLAENAIALPDGSFMVWRGGINEIIASGFPAPIAVTLILRIEAEPSEAQRVHRFTLRVTFDDKDVLPTVPQPLAFPTSPAEPRLYFNLIANLRFPVAHEGECVIQGTIDEDIQLPLIYLRVRTAPNPFFFTPGMPRSQS